MAITFVSSNEQTTNNDATPLTMTQDIGTRTSGLLLALVATVDSVTHTHGAATWAGVTMDQAVSAVSETVAASIFQRVSIYYLANPANGSNTFSLVYDESGATDQALVSYIVLAWFDGAHQTQASVKDQHNSGSGSTDPSVSVTPGENNELVVSMYASEADAVLTPSQTLIQSQDQGTRTQGASYIIQTTAGAQAMSWTGVDANWVAVAASFKQAGGSPQTISASLHTNTQTFYDPALSFGAITISASLLTNTQSFFDVVVTPGAITVAPSLFTNTQTFFDPALSFGAITIDAGLLTNTSTVYEPAVSVGGQFIQADLHTNSQTFFAPALTFGAITVNALLLTNTSTLYSPAVLAEGDQTIVAALLTNVSVLFSPVLLVEAPIHGRTDSVEAKPRIHIPSGQPRSHAPVLSSRSHSVR